jgi:hypothetical protein
MRALDKAGVSPAEQKESPAHRGGADFNARAMRAFCILRSIAGAVRRKPGLSHRRAAAGHQGTQATGDQQQRNPL